MKTGARNIILLLICSTFFMLSGCKFEKSKPNDTLSIKKTEQKQEVVQNKSTVSKDKNRIKDANEDPDLKLALQAYKEKKYAKAVSVAQNKLKNKPENAYLYYNVMGLSYGVSGKLDKAQASFESSIKENPNDWTAYAFLGDVMRAKHKYNDALNYYEKALSLPSMTREGKKYYKNLIEEVKKEQQAIINYEKSVKGADTGVNMHLDSDWIQISKQGNNAAWMIEYGIKGENVKDYKWSKLVTAQFYGNQYYKDRFKDMPLNEFYSKQMELLKIHAKSLDTDVQIEAIKKSPAEIIYAWNFGGKESEAARIIKTSDGIYHLHYAQKSIISAEDKKFWINKLKSVTLKRNNLPVK